MNSKVNVTKTKLETTELLNQKLTDAMMAPTKPSQRRFPPDSTDLEGPGAFSAKARRVPTGRLMSPRPSALAGEPFLPGRDAHGLGPSGAWT